MSHYTLYIANRNYSSWSLRPWLLMTELRIPFTETLVPFEESNHANFSQFSPNARVPCLHDGDTVIWDSLAILEHAAERMPRAGLWPEHPDLRAEARSVVAEMHAGFTALRTHMPMAIRERIEGRRDRPGVAEDIARVFALWRRCLARHGGPFLFCDWSAADIFFAPVATRLRTYGVVVPEDLAPYTEAILAHPHLVDWEAEAVREPWIVEIE